MALFSTGAQTQEYLFPSNYSSPALGMVAGGGTGSSFGPHFAASPSLMETSSYLPGYLLDGPSSPSPRSPQKLRHTPHYYNPRGSHLSSSPAGPISAPMASIHSKHYTSESRKHDSKPGGPPVQSLHNHTMTPIQHSSPFPTSPERRQLTFTRTVPRTNLLGTPNYPKSPATPSAIKPSDTAALMHPSPPSPGQMDPFYTQGESLTSEDTYNDHWVTIFGFPPVSASFIMEQFSRYGTIVDQKMSAEGNWMHLKYQTKLQAKTALSKNGKIYGDGIMVGVQPCVDKSVAQQSPSSSSFQGFVSTVDKSIPPQSPLTKKPSTMRPLTTSYQGVTTPTTSNQDSAAAVTAAMTPQKSSGFISRTLEYVFGW